jgi:hypothetical protein
MPVPVAAASRGSVASPVLRAAILAAAGATAFLVLAGPLGAQTAGGERRKLAGDDVAIYNLAGKIRVVGGSGNEVVVDVARQGRDAARLEIESGELRGRETLRVVYPDDDVVYPALGKYTQTRGRARSDGTFNDGRSGGIFSSDEVTIRGAGPGVEAWADITVSVPKGKTVALYLMAGALSAADVSSDLVIAVSAATIATERTRGRLVVDAGSGAVRITDAEGDLVLDAGSGSVELTRTRGRSLLVDAGSGKITGADIDAPTVRLDLGSGGARLAAVKAKELRLDTGSGNVDLELTGDVDDLLVDSGSGSVTLRVPPSLGAMLDVDTGSGGIDAQVPLQLTRRERDHLTARVGDGQGRIRIDAGSGAVRLIPRG